MHEIDEKAKTFADLRTPSARLLPVRAFLAAPLATANSAHLIPGLSQTCRDKDSGVSSVVAAIDSITNCPHDARCEVATPEGML